MSHATPDGFREPAPLILTARLDAQSFALLDGLRRRFFPAALNRVPAHVTLFHALPGSDWRAVSDEARARCASLPEMPFTAATTRFLGRGVALEIACPALVSLRGGLAAAWRDRLSAQDRQGYRPHLTVQNKVAPEEARASRATLEALLPISGRFDALALWHYRGGPWEEAGLFPFAGTDA